MSSKPSNELAPKRRLFTTVTPLVWTLLLVPGACIPKKSCEFTKTCASASDSDGSSATAQSAQSDGGAAGSLGDGAVGTGDAASTESPDGAPPVISCTRSTQCTDEVPYCDEVAQVCTGCRSSADCRSDEQRFCLVDTEVPQANRCVQCLAGGETCAGACVDNQCATCDPANNAGCGDDTPFCVRSNEAFTCVDCVQDEDCASSPSTPFCSQNQCKTCSSNNPDSCPPETPVCVEDETTARCVECAESSQCASPTDGGNLSALCVQERCTTCALGNNNGCPTSHPFCAALVPNEDGGVEYLAPTFSEAPASNQYLEYEHVCVECLDNDACGGSLPGCFDGQCVQCTENAHCKEENASVCDTTSHTCVGCQAIGDCSHQKDASACDIENRTCVACTAAEDTCADKACRTVPGDGQYTCSSANKGQTAPCFPCVSDSACLPDSKCVQETYGSAERGWRCFWQEARVDEDNECGDNRVFTIPFSATSVDGESGNYCTLRLSSCEGYRDFGTGPVTNNNGQPTCTSHDDCGLPDLDDGFCIPATSNNRCTYACLSNQDCDSPLQCATQTGVDQTQAKVCLLNP